MTESTRGMPTEKFTLGDMAYKERTERYATQVAATKLIPKLKSMGLHPVSAIACAADVYEKLKRISFALTLPEDETQKTIREIVDEALAAAKRELPTPLMRR